MDRRSRRNTIDNTPALVDIGQQPDQIEPPKPAVEADTISAVILAALPQSIAFGVLAHIEGNPALDPQMDALHAYVWDTAGSDDTSRLVWDLFDAYYSQQLRHTYTAWERRGKKRTNKPPKNKWVASRGNPNSFRQQKGSK